MCNSDGISLVFRNIEHATEGLRIYYIQFEIHLSYL